MRIIQYRIDQMGSPIPEPSTERWMQWLAEYRRAGKHVVRCEEMYVNAQHCIVSSIFVGTDLSSHDPPLLYETMVFGGTLSGWRLRWSSASMATFGTGLLVGFIAAQRDPEIVRHHISQLLVRSDAFAEGPPDSVQCALHGVGKLFDGATDRGRSEFKIEGG